MLSPWPRGKRMHFDHLKRRQVFTLRAGAVAWPRAARAPRAGSKMCRHAHVRLIERDGWAIVCRDLRARNAHDWLGRRPEPPAGGTLERGRPEPRPGLCP